MDDDFAPVETGVKAGVTRRGTVSLQMTAEDILSLAVNVANGWSLAGLGLDQTVDPVALNKMLREVYEQILDANRRAVADRASRAR